MVHYALICPPFFSHLRVFETLGAELRRRGHMVSFLLNEGAGALLANAGGVHEARGAQSRSIRTIAAHAARPSGLFGILRTVSDVSALTGALCRDGPAILAGIGAEVVIGDEMEPAAGLLAEHLGLAHVSVACALPHRADPAVPPPFLSWPFDPSRKGLKRNRGGARVARRLLWQQRRTIRGWSHRFAVPERELATECLSPLLRLSQTVGAFDFPAAAEPLLREVGPIRGEAVEAPLPFALTEGRPVVFASLGTMQGHRAALFRRIAKACRKVGALSVVAHCGGLGPAEAAALGADIVTDFLPQRTMLARADLCVTHAGLNTALDALAAGTPMLCLPIAFDQPGVAARIAHHGAGERLNRRLASTGRIAASLERLLRNDSYRSNAARIGAAIRASGGAVEAVDHLERTFGRAAATLVSA